MFVPAHDVRSGCGNSACDEFIVIRIFAYASDPAHRSSNLKIRQNLFFDDDLDVARVQPKLRIQENISEFLKGLFRKDGNDPPGFPQFNKL